MKKILLIVFFVCIYYTVFSQEYVYRNLNYGKELIDVSKYQTNHPEEIIFLIPDDIKTGIFSAPLNYIDQLVEFLVSWTDDDYLKIKSIHDWIVCNISYDVVAYNKGEIKIEQPHITLRYKTAVCGGYSTLFTHMAIKAGFDVKYVPGYSKGRSKYAIQPLGIFTRHAWNCIKINDIWYLIDTTWNSGYVNGNKFTFAYSTDYFLTDPNIFVNRHYPEAPGYLLTEKFISIEDFRNMKIQ